MMRAKVSMLALAALLLVPCGCFTVEEASSPALGSGVKKHVLVENYGWYLFGCVPIVCGNENVDSWCPFSLFSDEVEMPIAYSKLEELAEREGCKIADLHIDDDNEVLFNAYYVTIPWVVVCKDVSISANLVETGGGGK